MSATWSFTVPGPGASGDVTASWGSVPDLNGDGYADLLVRELQPPLTFVYWGGAGGLNPDRVGRLQPDLYRSELKLASAGDVDGDGVGDLVEADEQRISVVRGSLSGQLASAIDLMRPADSTMGLTAIAGAGDVNGDGYADIVAGFHVSEAPGVEVFHPDVIRVYVYYGAATGMETRMPLPIPTPVGLRADTFGYQVTGLGDLNDDGFSDFGLAHAGITGNDGAQAGYVYLGGALGAPTIPSLVLAQPAGVPFFGCPFRGVGDMTGDGRPELLVGGVGAGGEGRAYLFSVSGSATAVQQGNPLTTQQRYSCPLFSSIGDVNGDGRNDLLIPTTRAAFEVRAGVAGGFAATPTGVLELPAGTTLHAFSNDAGDLNGDGFDDVAVGVRERAQVLVYYGSSSGLPAMPSVVLNGGNGFGLSVL